MIYDKYRLIEYSAMRSFTLQRVTIAKSSFSAAILAFSTVDKTKGSKQTNTEASSGKASAKLKLVVLGKNKVNSV